MSSSQIQSIASVTSGKLYVELKLELFEVSRVWPPQTIFGISGDDLRTGGVNEGEGIGVSAYGACWQNGSEPAHFDTGESSTLVPGDVVRIWFDIDNLIWWAGLNDVVKGEPDAGTNPVNAEYPLEGSSAAWFARFSTHIFTGETAMNAIRVRLCVKPSQMTYPPGPGWKTLEA